MSSGTLSRGRPSAYTREIADEICTRLAAGEFLRAICRTENFPSESTVRGWAKENREGFFSQYTRARDMGSEGLVDLLIEIAEDSSRDWVEVQSGNGEPRRQFDHENIKRSQLQVDTLKWYLSKLAPKKYGDRFQHEVSPADPNVQVTICR